MSEDAKAHTGDWVEITGVVLAPGERAEGLPEDTAQVPLVMRVRGAALADATVGESIKIRTPAGRTLEGTLAAVSPGYDHNFGGCVPELVHVRETVREALAGLDTHSGI